MRRKPSSQGNGNFNNQQRKQRFQQGGSNGGERSHNHHGQNRPRKNYSAAREKYLAQARDALASGDRVLAENYFQHADHCYRMMVEEGYLTRNNYTPPPQAEESASPQEQEQGDTGAENTNQLPAFLTADFEQPDQAKPQEPVIVQNWEEQ